MTYDSKKVELGREPITIIEIDSGACSLVYSNSPCTASIPATGDQECFNRRQTCQDPDNYTATTHTDRFCQPRANLPIGVNMIPSIVGEVARAPTTTTAGKGLGNRAVVKTTYNDHTWHDRDVDPYVNNRSYNPEDQGTYWGKWLARNPFFEGREYRVLTGFLPLAGDAFSFADFQTEYYDITDIAGPTNGKVTITAKDILTRTYSKKAQYPAASVGELLADITSGATSATLSPAGIGNSDYPASGTISIGKEAMSFTRAGDALTLTRATFGTEAKGHKEGDTVQICATWDTVNVLDVLEELLVTGAGIPASFIPNGGGENWTIERSLWMNSANVTGILMKPEPIDKIIAEHSECFMFDIWWAAVDQEVQVKALSPEPSGVTIETLSDDYHLLADSISIKKDSKQRVSEVRVYYNKGDFSQKNDTEEFGSLFVSVDPSASSSVKFGSENIREIFCRWFDDKGQAAKLAGRTTARFLNTPSIVSFLIDVKDDAKLSMAGRIELDTKHIQDFTGANLPSKFQVTKIKETKPGSQLQVTALTSSFDGRYWFIAPDGLSDYSAATAEERDRFAFVGYNTGVFLDGAESYKII